MLFIVWHQRYDRSGSTPISGFSKSVDLHDHVYGRELADKLAQVTESAVNVGEYPSNLDPIFADATVHDATELLKLVRHLREQQESLLFFHALAFDQTPTNSYHGRDLLKVVDQFEEAIRVIDPDKQMAVLREAAGKRRAIVLADRNKVTT